MKRILIFITAASVILTGCNSSSIGIIGGADGPTAIIVGENKTVVHGQFGEQYEKRPIRMINVGGELYFDSGIISNTEARCGTPDGELKKAAEEAEIPHNAGEANFNTEGYQNSTSITKEVNIDGNWVIFKKYRRPVSKEFKYCFYIRGHMNNAAVDSELVVLTDNKDITFSQVYEPMLSSQINAGKNIGLVSHDWLTTDKWGISITADNITNNGITVKCEQFGGDATGDLQTGDWYSIEKSTDGGWEPVPQIKENVAWNSIAYEIKKNDITEFKVNWKWVYGELSPGYYRLSKEIMDFRKTGDFDKEIYYAYFDLVE